MRLRTTSVKGLAIVGGVSAGSLLVAWGALVVLLRTDGSYASSYSLSTGLSDLPIALAFAAVGVFVTLKRPANLVGWALQLAGVGLLVGGVLEAYGRLALLAKPEAGLPAGGAAAALARGAWTPLMSGVFLLLMVFPSGRTSSRRVSRFVGLVLGGFAAVWAILATAPGLDKPFKGYGNPLAVTASNHYIIVAYPIIATCFVSVVVAGTFVVKRFRGSRGQERQQFKWFAATAGLLILTLPFAAASNYSHLAGAVITVELIALPISVGIAVLRYRLYEIDRLISRTLVYGSLTVILGAAYAGLVLAGQAVFSRFAGGSNLAIAVSTLIAVALFLPVRSRVQRFVDRRFYRRRYDAQRTLEAFGARLREQVELQSLSTDLRGVVQETMQPDQVSLWLRDSRPR